MSSAHRILRTMIVLGAMWLCLSTRGFGDGEGETVSTSGGESADWTKRRYPSENLWAGSPPRDQNGESRISGFRPASVDGAMEPPRTQPVRGRRRRSRRSRCGAACATLETE